MRISRYEFSGTGEEEATNCLGKWQKTPRWYFSKVLKAEKGKGQMCSRPSKLGI